MSHTPWIYLILRTSPWGKYYYPHFTDEDTDDPSKYNTTHCGVNIWTKNYPNSKALPFLLHHVVITNPMFISLAFLLFISPNSMGLWVLDLLSLYPTMICNLLIKGPLSLIFLKSSFLLRSAILKTKFVPKDLLLWNEKKTNKNKTH